MPGDPWVYIPAFCGGAGVCLVYAKQVFIDGREADPYLPIFLFGLGYMAIVELLYIAQTYIPPLDISLAPYRELYATIGAVAVLFYAVFGLQRKLFSWSPPEDE